MATRGGPAMRTSGGPGGGSCWAKKSGRFYGREQPSRESGPPPNACSTWPPDTKTVAERTVSLTGLELAQTPNGRSLLVPSPDFLSADDSVCPSLYRVGTNPGT